MTDTTSTNNEDFHIDDDGFTDDVKHPSDRNISFGNSDTPTNGNNPTNSPTPRRRRRGCWWWLLLIVVLIGAGFVYFRYFSPYVSEAQAKGTINTVEKRGLLFKTYEANASLNITPADFEFSIDNDSLARVAQRYAGTGIPVTVTYRTFYATVPWRGASVNVATSITEQSPQQ